MVKRIYYALIFSALLSPAVFAGGRNFGIGLVVGEPTGLTAKYWTSQTTAFDLGLGWGWGYSGYDRYGYGYTDDRCYDPGFYNTHPGFCDARSYADGRYSRYDARGFHIHGDYLFHNFNLIKGREKIPLYYGPGLSYEYWYRGSAQFGIRGVGGIAWLPRNAPLDVFFELAPVLELFPGTWVDMNAGLGIRFYF